MKTKTEAAREAAMADLIERAKEWLTENEWHEGDSPEQEQAELKAMLESDIPEWMASFVQSERDRGKELSRDECIANLSKKGYTPAEIDIWLAGYDYAGYAARGSQWVAVNSAVFAVVFSNYQPFEIDSLWTTKELAESRRNQLGDMWGVQEMTVNTEPYTADSGQEGE